jgi:uncharacterized protein (DUF58 family)
MVREYEREERDVVWLLLDASVELWSGVLGAAPLDKAIDEVASAASRHIARGDRVGLGVIAARELAWELPERGIGQITKLMALLATRTGCLDSDRSDLDEADVALRVLEHMRPLDPEQALRVRRHDLDRLARRSDRVRARAPFPATEVYARSSRERRLRRYLGQFGIAAPARTEPERSATDRRLAQALSRVFSEKPRASIVYLWSPVTALAGRPELERALRSIPKRHAELRWVPIRQEEGIPRGEDPVVNAVQDALTLRARLARGEAILGLRRLGIRVAEVKATHAARPFTAEEQTEEGNRDPQPAATVPPAA